MRSGLTPPAGLCQEWRVAGDSTSVTVLTLHRDTQFDWLSGYSPAVVDDGQPDRNWHVISDHCRLLFDEPGGRMLGFDTRAYSSMDAVLLEDEDLFGEPRFDVPMLGLHEASVGEICLAARAFLGEEPTLDRAYFHAAVEAGERRDLEEAAQLWALSLEAGGLEAHFGLGYTLVELGRPRDAYGHLRYYTELTPANAWAWCWRGQAADGLGDQTEAACC